MVVFWLFVCQAASARTFVLCLDSCCTDEFCGPVQTKKLCSTEAMMCGFTKSLETTEAVTPPEPFPSAAIACRAEPQLAPVSEPVIYLNRLTPPHEGLLNPPPVPPPRRS